MHCLSLQLLARRPQFPRTSAWSPRRGLLKLRLHPGVLRIEYGLDLGLLRVREIQQGGPGDRVGARRWAAAPADPGAPGASATPVTHNRTNAKNLAFIAAPLRCSLSSLRSGAASALHLSTTFQLTDTVVAEVQAGSNQSLEIVNRLRSTPAGGNDSGATRQDQQRFESAGRHISSHQ